ncbi:MAG: MBOAT family O-acyltransferase [Flavobacteriales bacterium]
MLFNSLTFLYLLAPTFLLYYLPFMHRWQLHLIITASFIFYAYSEPWLLTLLVISICINIVASYGAVHGAPDRRKAYATLGVVVNLSILLFFKYSPLFGRTFFSGTDLGSFLVAIPLPVGISFFTFQGISLAVDAYRGRDLPEYKSIIVKNIWQHSLRSAAFKSFFPQLIAGPVVKAKDFLPQIATKTFARVDWEKAIGALVVGYFLKMVVADNLSEQTFWLTYPYFKGLSSITLIALLFGYSMQIFADFAGYSLIAIGLGHLFGYTLMTNFNFPYLSRSFSEFWKRWHISLSSFLREYLYIPLGGNRKGPVRTYVNLMATMVLGGLWHGAAWSYAVWGAFHGGMLAVERLLHDKFNGPFKVPKLLSTLFIFFSVTLAWLLFKLPKFDDVIAYMQALGNNWSGADMQPLILFFIGLLSIPVVAYHLFHSGNEDRARARRATWRPYAYGIMLFLLLTNSGSGGAFIYFQF